jgi:oligopeptide/dipeptide ABC transporter ATP-binding protein
MIFQDPMTSLSPLVPVGRQITETLVKHKGMTRRQASERAVELLALVGIPAPRERMSQFPYELSGGMRQRVMIAAAIAPEPKLVIADEPTTALDATIQAQILELIASLQSQLGLTMLLITHDLGVVAGVCDRVVVMYSGRQVEEGQAELVFDDPRHHYTSGLLSAAPSIHATGRRLVAIPGSPPRGAGRARGCPFARRCAAATGACAERMPPTTQDAPGHAFACWHPRRREVVLPAGGER